MPLQPSRRDTVGPPGDNVSNLAARVRHQGSYLRSIDPGILEGRFATPKPVPKGAPHQLVGGDAAGDDNDYAWEYDDRHTIVVAGTQTPRLSHIPIDETLHVFWHPRGNGGLRLTSEFFTVDDQVVTIPNPGYFSIGDKFSFQYKYEVEDNVPEPSVVGFTEPGVITHATNRSFVLPAGTAPGDLLVLTVRGGVAAGGGELLLDVACSDSRLTRAFKATVLNSGQTIVETVWVGFADGSGSPIDVQITRNPSYDVDSSAGVLVAITGVNGIASLSPTEPGGTLGVPNPTPTADTVAAVALTWIRGISFGVLNAIPPDGYTDIASTGLDYYSTDISLWSDPDADTSPAGTFSGEGCLVIGLT